jgi:hypothetical protein
VKEVQDWVRETIIEYGDISQSTLKMRGGADLGHPPQMFVDAAEMLAEHESGSDPIRRYEDKDGKVRYTTAPLPERIDKRAAQTRMVREPIQKKRFVTAQELQDWANTVDGAQARTRYFRSQMSLSIT